MSYMMLTSMTSQIALRPGAEDKAPAPADRQARTLAGKQADLAALQHIFVETPGGRWG